MNTPELHADNTMSEVLEAFPGAQRALMRRYHIGGCSSCGFSPTDRLGEVLKRHGVLDVDEVIRHIKDSHEQEAYIHVSPAELAEIMKGDNAPRLVDVRGEEECDIAKLDDSTRLTQEMAQQIMNTWAKDTPIVFYCHHGMRSMEAASYFIGHGFTNVRSLSGGIDAWAQEVNPALARY